MHPTEQIASLPRMGDDSKQTPEMMEVSRMGDSKEVLGDSKEVLGDGKEALGDGKEVLGDGRARARARGST